MRRTRGEVLTATGSLFAAIAALLAAGLSGNDRVDLLVIVGAVVLAAALVTLYGTFYYRRQLIADRLSSRLSSAPQPQDGRVSEVPPRKRAVKATPGLLDGLNDLSYEDQFRVYEELLTVLHDPGPDIPDRLPIQIAGHRYILDYSLGDLVLTYDVHEDAVIFLDLHVLHAADLAKVRSGGADALPRRIRQIVAALASATTEVLPLSGPRS